MPGPLLWKCKVSRRGLCNLQLGFWAWWGHFVRLLQEKGAQAASPVSPHPRAISSSPHCMGYKVELLQPLADRAGVIPTEMHSEIIHKGSFSPDTLHGPRQHPLTLAWCCPRQAVGSVQSYSVTVLPSHGTAVPLGVPIHSLGRWRVKFKTPLSSLLSSKQAVRKRKPPVGLGSSKAPMFLSDEHFLFMPQCFVSKCTG